MNFENRDVIRAAIDDVIRRAWSMIQEHFPEEAKELNIATQHEVCLRLKRLKKLDLTGRIVLETARFTDRLCDIRDILDRGL